MAIRGPAPRLEHEWRTPRTTADPQFNSGENLTRLELNCPRVLCNLIYQEAARGQARRGRPCRAHACALANAVIKQQRRAGMHGPSARLGFREVRRGKWVGSVMAPRTPPPPFLPLPFGINAKYMQVLPPGSGFGRNWSFIRSACR